MKKKKEKMSKEEIVKKFRDILDKKGHSLKWWHRENISDICKYNYFIRQINLPESMQENLFDAILDYIGGEK